MNADQEKEKEKELETATFAAGCFWGVEAIFKQVKGVVETAVGYTGGSTPDPNYRQVCTGITGHAVAVQIRFDPKVVSYEELLSLFWRMHDPTTPDRQGPDTPPRSRPAESRKSHKPSPAAPRWQSANPAHTSGRKCTKSPGAWQNRPSPAQNPG